MDNGTVDIAGFFIQELVNPTDSKPIEPPPGLEATTSDKGPGELGPEEIEGPQEPVQDDPLVLELQCFSVPGPETG